MPAEKFDVDVKRARAEADFLFAVAPERRLDLMDFFEQGARADVIVQKSDQSHIEKIVLVRDVHRLRTINRRKSHAAEDFRKLRNRAAKNLFGTQTREFFVRAKSKRDSRHFKPTKILRHCLRASQSLAKKFRFRRR